MLCWDIWSCHSAGTTKKHHLIVRIGGSSLKNSNQVPLKQKSVIFKSF